MNRRDFLLAAASAPLLATPAAAAVANAPIKITPPLDGSGLRWFIVKHYTDCWTPTTPKPTTKRTPTTLHRKTACNSPKTRKQTIFDPFHRKPTLPRRV
jgi:hypothetical protein